MGAEYEVDRIVAQPILGHAHARAKTAQLEAQVTRRIDQAEGMQIPLRLNDAQVDIGKIAHRRAPF